MALNAMLVMSSMVGLPRCPTVSTKRHTKQWQPLGTGTSTTCITIDNVASICLGGNHTVSSGREGGWWRRHRCTAHLTTATACILQCVCPTPSPPTSSQPRAHAFSTPITAYYHRLDGSHAFFVMISFPSESPSQLLSQTHIPVVVPRWFACLVL
jgi:hypothetical protein